MKIHYEIWQHSPKNRDMYLYHDFMCLNLGDKTLALNYHDFINFYKLGTIESYDVMIACLNDGKKAGCVDIAV